MARSGPVGSQDAPVVSGARRSVCNTGPQLKRSSRANVAACEVSGAGKPTFGRPRSMSGRRRGDFPAGASVAWPTQASPGPKIDVAAPPIPVEILKPRPARTWVARGEKWQPGFRPGGYETAARRVTPTS